MQTCPSGPAPNRLALGHPTPYVSVVGKPTVLPSQGGPDAARPTASPRRASNYDWIPALVLVLALAATAVTTYSVRLTSDSRDQVRFTTAVATTTNLIKERLALYSSGLRGGASFFAAGGVPTRAQFKQYADRLDLSQTLPGIQGFGFAARVSLEEKDAFLQSQRLQGLTDFSITPPGERSEYFPIIYLEPQDRRNRAAIGYDMFAESVRHEAMSRARDQGRSAASGKVELVQEIDPVKQPGFLLYMPVYRDGQVPATVAERRTQLLGFVYSPFRAHDLFQHIFPQSLSDVRFQIYDGSLPTPEALLFESEPREPDLAPLSAAVPFHFSGHRWTIQFETTREFAEGSYRFLIPWVLVGGLALSLLLFGMTGALAAAHRRLRKAEAALKDHVDHLEETVTARTAQLRETVSELEHMSYSLVHDMRAPLRAIQSFSTMLEESSGAVLNPDACDYLGRIRRAANRMDALIRDVLNYGEVVRQELPLRPLEVGPIVRGILESYPGLAEADITVAEDIPPVLANEAALTQCFSNLLLNAVKFAKPGVRPKVSVTGQTVSNGVRVCVADNGIGIPKPMQEKVFDLFERLDNSKEGTGIGLAVVRKAAERMGGSVGLESELGVGTRFCLELKSPNSGPESATR